MDKFRLVDSLILRPNYGPSLAVSIGLHCLIFFNFPFTRGQIQSTKRVARMLCFQPGMDKVLLEHSRGSNNNNNNNNAVLSVYFTAILNSIARSGDMKGNSGCEM